MFTSLISGWASAQYLHLQIQISIIQKIFLFQAGDGYLAGLAARFASELHFEEDDVLHQLEDLRSAATSEWPSIRSVVNPAASNNQRRMSETESHNYANYPGNLEDKSFLPGIYAVSISAMY